VADQPIDPYATLQVAPDANDEVVAAAYRALARRNHPDVAGEHATETMARINAAWELVGTPEARAAHDRTRRSRLQPVGPGRQASAPRAAPDTSAQADVRAWARAYWHAPAADGSGAAGPPPGRPSGSILPFGRHVGWSLGEIARVDPGYLEWLDERVEGRAYRAEIDALLRRLGRREEPLASSDARGRFSRS
jgi:curved DNA-binding protein CbpA